jgi:DNA invertase Pin-like site-specific DNA recombinase
VGKQAREVRRYAKRQALCISKLYIDAAENGATLDRPQLRKLIADCRKGKIGKVLVQDPDRLSRNTGALMALFEIFCKTGVSVEFTTPAGRNAFEFLLVVLGVVAQRDVTANRQ